MDPRAIARFEASNNAKNKTGRIDGDDHIGIGALDIPGDLTDSTQDLRHAREDFGQPHDGELSVGEQAFEARSSHLWTANP